MKKFIFLLPVLFMLTSCDLFNNYGKKIEFDKSQVYYKGEGVTKEEAQSLGDFLVEQDYFNKETPKTAQITHDGEDYLVHFVVDQKKLTEAARFSFWKFQNDLSKQVFEGKSVRIVLADDKLEDIETLNPIAIYKNGKSTIYYDNSEVRKSEAAKLMDFFVENKLMGEDKEADAFYRKEEKMPVVRMVVDPKKITEESMLAFSYFQQLMKEQLFDGKKVKMLLTSSEFEDMDPLPKLTAEQRQAFDEEMNPTTKQDEQTLVDSSITESTTSGVLRLPND